MSKITPPPWVETNRIMLEAGFTQSQLRRAQIWAAKHRPCPKCKAAPYVSCRNLTGIKNFGFDLAKENKFPHSERIDFDKLKRALNERGYE